MVAPCFVPNRYFRNVLPGRLLHKYYSDLARALVS
jgi:hypothetical protein